MAEYIERESLLKAISKVGGIPLSEWDTAGVVSLVVNQPADDVTPVRRGKWLNFYNDYRTAECSVCAELYEVTFDGESNSALFDCFKRFYKYCPNCGADMREVPNDD